MPHRRIASGASSAFGGGGGGGGSSSSAAAAGDGADDDNDAICVGVWEVSSTEVRKALPEGRASGLIQVTHCPASQTCAPLTLTPLALLAVLVSQLPVLHHIQRYRLYHAPSLTVTRAGLRSAHSNL